MHNVKKIKKITMFQVERFNVNINFVRSKMHGSARKAQPNSSCVNLDVISCLISSDLIPSSQWNTQLIFSSILLKYFHDGLLYTDTLIVSIFKRYLSMLLCSTNAQ